MMIFTFAGSSHTRYTSYLLEFIVDLEMESSPELRKTVLTNLLVNLSGQPGRFSPVDLIQEYFNRLLQAIAERKGAEYNAHFIRNVVSRNLHHLARLLNDMKESIGLMSRSGHHHTPHNNPELRILLKEYKHHELHYRRPGRSYTVNAEDNERVNDHIRGISSLRNGKLAKWIKETTYMRSIRQEMRSDSAGSCPSGVPARTIMTPTNDFLISEDAPDDVDDNALDPAVGQAHPLSMCYMTEGSLVVDEVDISADAQLLLSTADSDVVEEDDSDDNDSMLAEDAYDE